MKIWISSLRDVHEARQQSSPGRIISLLSPGSDFPSFDGYGEETHRRIEVYDILQDAEGRDAPTRDHVTEIVDFLKVWSPQDPLLVHCWAGMSRSTATAFIAACMHNPDADEAIIAEAIAGASPTAFPNTRIVAIADEMLGRKGRMVEPIEKIRADEARLAKIYEIQESTPFSIPAYFDGANA